jgi:hypothetical protein
MILAENFLLGNRKKIAKFLMRTFTCRSAFLYEPDGSQTFVMISKIVKFLQKKKNTKIRSIKIDGKGNNSSLP